MALSNVEFHDTFSGGVVDAVWTLVHREAQRRMHRISMHRQTFHALCHKAAFVDRAYKQAMRFALMAIEIIQHVEAIYAQVALVQSLTQRWWCLFSLPFLHGCLLATESKGRTLGDKKR